MRPLIKTQWCSIQDNKQANSLIDDKAIQSISASNISMWAWKWERELKIICLRINCHIYTSKLQMKLSNCTSFRNLWSARVDNVHSVKGRLSISSEKLLSTEISSKYMLTIPSAKLITKSSSMETPCFLNRLPS